jgi:myosin heavy subunit
MQIQYNITRIEEWCKSHDMPEGTLQLEHLMQATKLLQLKKVGHSLKVLDCVSPLKLNRQRLKTLRLSTTSAGC